MARPTFLGPSQYAPSLGTYRLLPFRFMDVDGRKLVVNEVGEHEILDEDLFEAFVGHRLALGSDTYHDLKAKHFLVDSQTVQR
jgi:uncharacterized protein